VSQYSTHRVAYEVLRKWQRVWWNWGYTGVDTRVLEIEYSSQSVPQLHFQIFQNLWDLTDLICDPKVPTPWFQQRDPDPKLRNRAPPLADPKRERRFHVTKIPGPVSIIPWYSMVFHVSSCFTAFLECWSMPKSAGAVIGAHDRMAARVFFLINARCQHWSTRPQYWSTWRSGKLSGSYMKLRIEVDQGWSILSGCSLRNAYRSPTTQSYEVGRTLVFEQATSICKQNGLNQTEPGTLSSLHQDQ